MRYFLEKAEKSLQRWGLRPQTPLAFGCWEIYLQNPELHFSTPLKLKFRLIISYLSDS